MVTQGSNGDLKKTPEAKKRKSRGEMNNAGVVNGGG
jgi:hypothetical protein